MKHSLLPCLFFAFLSLHNFAQESSSQADNTTDKVEVEELRAFLPNAGDWGVTVNASGILRNIQLTSKQDLLSNSSILLRYTESNRWTFRFGLSPQLYHFNVTTTDSVGKDLVEFDSTSSQSSIGFRPGVEYHFSGTKRLDPYVAFDLEFGVVGGMRIGSVTNTTDTTGTSRVMRTITEDGGYSLGAKLSAGFNYFMAKRIFIGMEYGMGITNVSSGGDRQEVVQIEPVSGTNTTLRKLSSARMSVTQFYVDPMVQITLGYFFAR
ncbi:MAG: hypothetical protein RLP15_05080 [Cryomorphaceae bacterium]